MTSGLGELTAAVDGEAFDLLGVRPILRKCWTQSYPHRPATINAAIIPANGGLRSVPLIAKMIAAHAIARETIDTLKSIAEFVRFLSLCEIARRAFIFASSRNASKSFFFSGAVLRGVNSAGDIILRVVETGLGSIVGAVSLAVPVRISIRER